MKKSLFGFALLMVLALTSIASATANAPAAADCGSYCPIHCCSK